MVHTEAYITAADHVNLESSVVKTNYSSYFFFVVVSFLARASHQTHAGAEF